MCVRLMSHLEERVREHSPKQANCLRLRLGRPSATQNRRDHLSSNEIYVTVSALLGLQAWP